MAFSRITKATVFIALFIMVSGLFSVILSQNIEEGGNANGTDNAERQRPERVISIDQYRPVAVTDPRISVTGLNFDRRYAMNGTGEFLDVVFYVNNLTSEDIRLRAYVVAAYETDTVDEDLREWIPYPVWRNRDFAEERVMTHHIAITPGNINKDVIWDVNDADYVEYKTMINRMRNSVAGDRPIPEMYPPLWKYLQYINTYPENGLLFTLYGDKSPPVTEAVQSNYVAPTPEEMRKKIFHNLDAHTYTLEHTRRKTIFRSHHYSNFRAYYRFFNTVAIMIFDDVRMQEYIRQRDAGEVPAGERVINPLIYKKIFQIDIPEAKN